MSRYADLLIAQGENSARARAASGAIWGRAIESISQIPGQVAQQRRADNQFALVQQREARESAAAAQEQQLRGLQIAGTQKTAQEQSKLEEVWSSGILNPDNTINLPKAEGLLRDAGMAHRIPDFRDQANKWAASDAELQGKKDTATKAAMDLRTAQRDQIGLDALDLRRSGYDPGDFHAFVAKRAKDGLLPVDQANTWLTQTDADPTQVKGIVDGLIAGSKTAQAQRASGFKEIPEGGTLVDLNAIDPTTGKPPVIASGAGKPKDEFQTFKESYPQSLGVATWEALTPAQKVGANAAYAKSKQDPAMLANAAATRALVNQERQQRIDAANTKAEPLDVGPDVRTTVSGKKYLDLSAYAAGDRAKARAAAADAGAVTVSKEENDAITNIDNARLNQRDILTQIQDLLPKGPAGRVIAMPGVALSKLLQTDEQRAAYGAWRSAAINTLRATAGSKGLRINKAEIQQALENDIPKLTDTWGTAQQKVKNINQLLDNAEASVLVRDRSAAAGVPSEVATVLKGQPAGRHTLSDGSVWLIDASGAITKGK